LEKLSVFEFEIEHHPGKLHGNHVMSRILCPDTCRHCRRQEKNEKTEETVRRVCEKPSREEEGELDGTEKM
jgi:hypothetical protein